MRTDGISFIILNRNHELVLPRSIRLALLAADHLGEHRVPAEVIVVDDASRDGSPVLLRQFEAMYHERGLRVVAFGRNAGPAVARDAGLHRARHRHAVLLDADDEIIPQNVHHFYRSIRETGAAVVYGNLIIINESGIDMCSNESFVARTFERNHIDACAMYDVQQLIDVAAFGLDHDAPEEGREMHLHLAAGGRRLVHVPMAFGLHHRDDLPRRREVAPEAREGDIRRIYRRHPEVRDRFHLNTLHLRYHPDLGYL